MIEALKLVEVLVDCTVEGLIHAPEWPEIEAAGNARLLVITNGHPEIPERTEPKAVDLARVESGIRMLREAWEMQVTLASGTDPDGGPARRPVRRYAGFWHPSRRGGALAGGLCLAFPGKAALNGRIVMDVGDMNLPFKTYLTSRIDCLVESDFVTKIDGDDIDALHFREYLEAWDDRNAYGISHVGWG